MEPIDSVPEASLKWTTGGVVVLLQTHYPYKCTGCKEVLIPRGAIGSADGKYIRWQVKMNLYDVALAEIQMLLQQVGYIAKIVVQTSKTNSFISRLPLGCRLSKTKL